MKIEQIAEICHQANKALCHASGDHSQVDWAAAPDWQKESAVKGVKFCLENPFAPASANHDAWMKEKIEQGWAYGEVKDAEKKTHPCITLYNCLPPKQQAKDYLFKAIVAGLAQYVEVEKKAAAVEDWIELTPVVSRAVEALGYDADREILALQFPGGSVYHYPDFSVEEYGKMCDADSMGAYIAKNVVRRPCTKVFVENRK